MFVIDIPEYRIKIREKTFKEIKEIYKKIRKILMKEGFIQQKIRLNIRKAKSFKLNNIELQIEYNNQVEKNGLNISFFQKKGEIFRFLNEQNISYLEYKKAEKIINLIYKEFKKEKEIIYIKKFKNKIENINYFILKSSFKHNIKEYKKFNLLDKIEIPDYVKKSSYSEDKDKKILKNHQIKYFRDDSTGRLKRGTIIHNINNMWWVIVNKDEIHNITSRDLFDINNHRKTLKYKRLKRDIKERWSKEQRKKYYEIIDI